MLSLSIRLDRAQRFVRMLEQDAPLLELRVAALHPEHQRSTRNYAAQLAQRAQAELEKIHHEFSVWDANDGTPQAAD
ncbi:MAG: hypothetical protein JOY93_12980 [Acidobacteriales bacterium]|nr:hypothetical protein [Terriglobales bacterium]